MIEECVHQHYCDSKQPDSFSVPFSKAVAMNEPILESSTAENLLASDSDKQNNLFS